MTQRGRDRLAVLKKSTEEADYAGTDGNRVGHYGAAGATVAEKLKKEGDQGSFTVCAGGLQTGN